VSRELKAGVLGLGIVGLLLVVAFASRGGHPTGDATVTERSVPVAIENTVVTLITIVYGIFLVAVIIVAFRHRRSWREPKDSAWLRSFAAIVLLMVFLTVGYFLVSRRPVNESPDLQGPGREIRIPELERRSNIPPRHADFNWPLALSIVCLVLASGTVLYLKFRPKGSPEPAATVQEDLAQAVDTTIEDLRRERDARRAVIAAYANMEHVLASHGLERHHAQTPFEYLARILVGLDVRESAVRQLTQLFEYAKFSPHEIDAAMKEEAIAALEKIRNDLRREEALAA
jgi:NADH:ubiquinone oxidoreductase subunit 5 (subunit L)/multisubunit Na+/H+ antiporter MnhA subunit